MSCRKIASFVALVSLLSMNAAQAGVEVLALVSNNTSSPVSLVGSGTYGTFLSPPTASIAASAGGGAVAFTPSNIESGFLQYGACTFTWDVYVFFRIDSYVSAFGSGCSANVAYELPTGPYSAFVIIEFSIN